MLVDIIKIIIIKFQSDPQNEVFIKLLNECIIIIFLVKDKLSLVFHDIIPIINSSLKKYLYKKSNDFIDSESVLFYRLSSLLLLQITPNECYLSLFDEDEKYLFILSNKIDKNDKKYNEKELILLLWNHIYNNIEIKEVKYIILQLKQQACEILARLPPNNFLQIIIHYYHRFLQYLFDPDNLDNENDNDSDIKICRSLLYIILRSSIYHSNNIKYIRDKILYILLLSLSIPSTSLDQSDPVVLLHMGLCDTISYLISFDINIDYYKNNDKKIIEITDKNKNIINNKPNKKNNIIYLLLYVLDNKINIKDSLSEIISFYNLNTHCNMCNYDIQLLFDKIPIDLTSLFNRTMNQILITCLKYKPELSVLYWNIVLSRIEKDGYNKIYGFEVYIKL